MDAIRAERLTKIYSPRRAAQTVTALSEVSLQVSQGEIFGLLGPNGAGKTTFIKLLLHIAFPTSGDARVLGHPAGSIEAKARLGYLPENHRYPAYLTGEQVLRHFGALSRIPRETLLPQIERALDLVEMRQWRKTKIRKYSKGMMQRIGLAQALLGNPSLIILDEPTDGVDPVGRRQIRELLVRLRGEGRTIFLNSHLLSEVEMICDRVAILDKGRLARIGAVSDLTRGGTSYTVAIADPVPDALRVQWEATRATVIVRDGTLDIDAATVDELNARLDQVRAHGIRIETVHRRKASLEDLFIDIVSKERA